MRGSWRQNKECNILTPQLFWLSQPFFPVLLGCSTGGLGTQPLLGHGSHSSIFSPTHLNSLSPGLYNNLTPTYFLRASQFALSSTPRQTIKHLIPKIEWAIVWALNYYITQSRRKSSASWVATSWSKCGRESHTRPKGFGALMSWGPEKILIRCSKESQHPAEWTPRPPVEHQKNEKDTTLMAMKVGVKISQKYTVLASAVQYISAGTCIWEWNRKMKLVFLTSGLWQESPSYKSQHAGLWYNNNSSCCSILY